MSLNLKSLGFNSCADQTISEQKNMFPRLILNHIVAIIIPHH